MAQPAASRSGGLLQCGWDVPFQRRKVDRRRFNSIMCGPANLPALFIVRITVAEALAWTALGSIALPLQKTPRSPAAPTNSSIGDPSLLKMPTVPITVTVSGARMREKR